MKFLNLKCNTLNGNKSYIPMYISLKELNKLNNMKTELMQIKEQKILAI